MFLHCTIDADGLCRVYRPGELYAYSVVYVGLYVTSGPHLQRLLGHSLHVSRIKGHVYTPITHPMGDGHDSFPTDCTNDCDYNKLGGGVREQLCIVEFNKSTMSLIC